MKRLFVLTALLLVLAGLLLSGIPDPIASVIDTSIPNDEITSSISKGSNSRATATIIITMTPVFVTDE